MAAISIGDLFLQPQATATNGSFTQSILIFVVSTIVGVILTISELYMCLLVRSLEQNDGTSWQDLLDTSLNKIGPMIGSYIPVFFFFLLFFLPGIAVVVFLHPDESTQKIVTTGWMWCGTAYFSYKYALLPTVVAYEKPVFMSYLKRNAQLIKGSFYDFFGAYLALVLVLSPVFAISFFSSSIPQPYQMILSIVSIVLWVPLTPFCFHYLYFVYTELIQRESSLRGIAPGSVAPTQ
ncbi:MAG: hypothetical protein HQL12_08260 [Candidatus Omnitrophica bacterium]|nr:hypothetical protein [Candidatus Omnitrophota bacterium]